VPLLECYEMMRGRWCRGPWSSCGDVPLCEGEGGRGLGMNRTADDAKQRGMRAQGFWKTVDTGIEVW
jgi:hypothetical protein